MPSRPHPVHADSPAPGALEAHLRSILATVPDAMVVIDEQGIVLSFSAAAEKMFGYPENLVVGRNVSLLMPSPDRDRHDDYLRAYLSTGERRIIGIGRVTTARHHDGYTFPIELAVGEAWVDGRRIFTGFIRDLTERQQTESRLQELQAELAHVGRVTEVGTLASALAHELNQPLTAVANYCETARDLLGGPLDPGTILVLREALDDAARQSVLAGQIVRRLRDFITHGQTERRVESLPRLINEAHALALVGSSKHGLDVEVDLDPQARLVLADRIQIQQVLVNLIRNAIDAMEDAQTRKLVIAAQRQSEGWIKVSVSDSGSGISPSVAGQMFQPFITSKPQGMGIGLSICRTIIEAHGGRIGFEAQDGGGTVFHFTLADAETEK